MSDELLQYWIEALNPLDIGGVNFFGMISRLETQLAPSWPHGWLTPWDGTNPAYQSWCVSLVMQYFVQPFTVAMAPYALPRGGPY